MVLEEIKEEEEENEKAMALTHLHCPVVVSCSDPNQQTPLLGPVERIAGLSSHKHA